MKKVLIILYYWPPSGGSGVQRGLYLVKYLRQFGWEPVVYTPSNPEYPAVDHSLEKEIPEGIEVVKHPIWEPYQIYKRFTGQASESRIKSLVVTEKKKKRDWAHRLSVWIRGNFFIPDARVMWVRPSIRFLSGYLKDHPVDAIISSSPPQSMHLIARGISERFKIPWIADFRDPWTGISYFGDLGLTKWAKSKHFKQERSVLNSADKVVTVSKALQQEFQDLGNRGVDLITNGFDERKSQERKSPPDNLFTISYVGTLSRDRNPGLLWKTMGSLLKNRSDHSRTVRIRMVGPIDHSVFESMEQAGLGNYLEKIDYVPHDEVSSILDTSHALLLIGIPGGNGVLTGKLFEYLDAQRFILSVGPKGGDVVEILESTGAGINADFDDMEAMHKAVAHLLNRIDLDSHILPRQNIDQFSRKSITGKFTQLLNEIVN